MKNASIWNKNAQIRHFLLLNDKSYQNILKWLKWAFNNKYEYIQLIGTYI